MLLAEFILNSQADPPGAPWLYRTLLELYLSPHLESDGTLAAPPPPPPPAPPEAPEPSAQGGAGGQTESGGGGPAAEAERAEDLPAISSSRRCADRAPWGPHPGPQACGPLQQQADHHFWRRITRSHSPGAQAGSCPARLLVPTCT